MGNSVARVNGTAYKILGTLGEGGSATVYEVHRRSDKRHFALKWVRGVREPEVLERLLLEIQVHRRLRHANILPLVDAEVRECEDEKQPPSSHSGSHHDRVAVATDAAQRAKEVLVLFPICSHGSLQTLLNDAFQKGGSPFSERACLQFFAALLDAVQHVHDMGYAHRDLKPGNILLSDTTPPQPMLMDFGSIAPLGICVRSAAVHAALCDEAASLSSAPYRPPELWASNGYAPDTMLDGRTDVWQLGCVLYAMAFGPYSPFENAREGVLHLAILNGTVRFPCAASPVRNGAPPQFSTAFTSFISWMLTPDIASRPTLADVRQTLEQLRAGGEHSAAAAARMAQRMALLSVCSDASLSFSSNSSGSEPVVAPSPSPPASSVSSSPSALALTQPPPTQVLSFSKLASDEWADFAAFEKSSRVDSMALSRDASEEDWSDFTGAARSNSTSMLSVGTLVWSTESSAVGAPGNNAGAGAAAGIGRQQQPSRRQSSRRHSIGSTVVVPMRRESSSRAQDTAVRRALSTRGRLLLSQALDGRASQ